MEVRPGIHTQQRRKGLLLSQVKGPESWVWEQDRAGSGQRQQMYQESSHNVTMLHSKVRNLCTNSSLVSSGAQVTSFLWVYEMEELAEAHITLAL